MKKLIRIVCAALIGISTLSCYDDTELRELVEKHEEKITVLEHICLTINSNVEALQTLTQAIQDADYITAVTPILEGNQEVGYEVTFAKFGKISIYTQASGQGSFDAPVIGAKEDKDGKFYWTINGEWLLDDNGEKVPTTGADGADGEPGAPGEPGKDGVDGITPQLKIQDDYWYVSYDNGKSWIRLGKAVGESSSENGKDSIFEEVYEKNGYLYFILTDGSSYKLPMNPTTGNATALDIEFDIEQGAAIVPNVVYVVNYRVIGGDENTTVRTILSDGPANAIARPATSTTGQLHIAIDSWFYGPDDPERDEIYSDYLGSITEEEFFNSILTVLVSVSDGKNNSIIKALNLTEGIIESVEEVYTTDAEGGILEVQVKTNADYLINIPESVTWLSCEPVTKANLRTDKILLTVEANDGEMARTGKIDLVNSAGNILETFFVVQKSAIGGNEMVFEDDSVKLACTKAFDANLDGILTYEEAIKVKNLDALNMPSSATSFDELKYFTSITNIPSKMFQGCRKLESVILPEQITSIDAYAFTDCHSLKSIIIPESVTLIGYNNSIDNGYVFKGCSSLKSITIPDSVKNIYAYGLFYDCTSLTSVSMPEITTIQGYMFYNCESLTSYEFSSSLNTIHEYAFYNSGLTGNIQFPESLNYIEEYAFAECDKLESVHIVKEEAFPCYVGFSLNTVIYVPEGCYDAYKDTWFGMYNWAEKTVLIGDASNKESLVEMEYDNEGWYVAELTTVDHFTNLLIIPDDCYGHDSSLYISSEYDNNAVQPEIIYNLASEGRLISLPTLGTYTIYVSEDFKHFKYTVQSPIIYFNDFDMEKASKSYGSNSIVWPYLDEFDGWKNQSGEGAKTVSYTFNGMSARSNSTSDGNYSDYEGSGQNNLFFGQQAFFSTNDITLNGNTDLTLSFGTEKYDGNDTDAAFDPSEFHVYLSNDGIKWVEIQYTFAGTAAGRWNVASTSFTVPSSTDKLSICVKADAASVYRIDDFRLVISEGGETVDFTKGVEMDFTEVPEPEEPVIPEVEGEGDGTESNPYDARRAYNIANSLTAEETITGVYVEGTISKIQEVSTKYGNATYWITDEDEAIHFSIFRGQYLDGNKFESENQIEVGDKVLICGNLINYKGSNPQMGQPNNIVRFIEDTPETPAGTTIADFLAAEVSSDTTYTVTGTIMNIEEISSTYKNPH